MSFNPRLFLQGMMWKKILDTKDVRKLFAACDDRELSEEEYLKELSKEVNKINYNIEPIHMRISKGVDEVTGEAYYALLNTLDSELSRISTTYMQSELELFKKILTCIVDSDDGKVEAMSALNLADELEKKVSKKDAQEIINKFCRERYLCEESGFVTLTTRGILELSPYIQKNYPELINHCFICRQIILQNVTCPKCLVKVHAPCKTKYFKETNRELCPHCKKSWDA